VKNLMMKYGLMSRILSKSPAVDSTSLSVSYLVPSLLPSIPPGAGILNAHARWNNSFYFFFTISEALVNSKVMSWGEMNMSGFLPSSLFQRLICKAVNWSQLTTVEKSSAEFSLLEVYKDFAVLRYGSQKFQVTKLVDSNCIRVDVDGVDPNPIYQRLRKQLEVLIEECMHSLRFVMTLLLVSSATAATSIATTASSRSDQFHITFTEAIKTFTNPGYVVDSVDKRLLISESVLKAQHPNWFNNLYVGLLKKYDAFISHRWGRFDDKLVSALFDRLTLHTVGASNRPIFTFLDSVRLQLGKHFQLDFAKALVKSSVIVPFVTRNALERMTVGRHDANKEDNVLVEWIMSLELAKVKGVRILPILAGSLVAMDKISNLNAETALDASGRQVPFLDLISRDIPVASLSLVKRLLLENSIPFDDANLKSYTVKGVVDEITKMLGYQASDIKPDELSVAISEQVRGVVVQCVAAEEAKALSSSSSSSSLSIAPASPVLSVFNSHHQQQVSSSSSLSMKEMADQISKELGLSASLSVSALIDQAIVFLGIGDRAVFRADSGATVRAKLEALMKEI